MRAALSVLGAAAGFTIFVGFALMFVFTMWALAQ